MAAISMQMKNRFIILPSVSIKPRHLFNENFANDVKRDEWKVERCHAKNGGVKRSKVNFASLRFVSLQNVGWREKWRENGV